MAERQCADAGRRRLQCHTRRHRLSQTLIVEARCSLSTGTSEPVPGATGTWVYGLLPVVTSERGGAVHLLGLFSRGFSPQQGHSNRSLLIIPNASRSARR